MASGTPDYQPAVFKILRVYSPLNSYQFNGTVSSTLATITIPGSNYSTNVWIQNNSWDSLLVSFDGGTTWLIVGGKTGFENDIRVQTFKIKSNHSTRSVSYNIIVGYE